MPLDPALYFDWAATAIPDQDILEAALKKSLALWANPSSVHSGGKAAREALEAAREKCAALLGVQAKRLFFTSGGTESDHIPLLSVLNKMQKGNVVVSSIEHPALREMAAELKKCSVEPRLVPANKDGFVTSQAVLDCVDKDTLFVSVMAVNNETGAVQPVKEIAASLAERFAGKRRPRFHVDCVQALGKIPIDFLNEDGVDSAAFSAHKISGPRGIGLLFLKKAEDIFLKGGGQEGGVRSGTENLFGALALADCVERHAILPQKQNPRFEEQKKMTANFIAALRAIKGCSIIPESRAPDDERFSPWIVQAAFKKIPGQVMLRALDAKGICVSTGSACSSKKASRPVLEAMGVPPERRETSVRFSFGHSTSRAATAALLKAVQEVCADFN